MKLTIEREVLGKRIRAEMEPHVHYRPNEENCIFIELDDFDGFLGDISLNLHEASLLATKLFIAIGESFEEMSNAILTEEKKMRRILKERRHRHGREDA